MRELNSVCLRCQLRQLVAARAHARRPAAAARWNSTAAGQHERVKTDEAVGRNGRDHIHNESWTTPWMPAPRPGLNDTRSRHHSSNLAMFQSIVESRTRLPAATESLQPVGPAAMGLINDVAKMQAMLERDGASLGAAYSFFEETVYPQLTKTGTAVPQIVKNQLAAILLNRLALEKPQDFESTDLPSVTRITEITVELDILKPAAWATLIIELIQQICRHSTVPDNYASIEAYENVMARRDALLRDLVGAWKVFGAQKAPGKKASFVKPQKGKHVEPRGPRADAKPQQQPTLQKVLGAMFPQYLGSTLLRPTFAAWATYKLLTDPFNRSRAIKDEAAPFLQMMKTLIFQARAPRIEDFRRVIDTFPDLHQFMRQGESGGGFVLDGVSAAGQTAEHRRISIHRQLGQAIKGRNVQAVKRAWVDFWGEAATPDTARIGELSKCPDMFDYFILAYMMMWRPNMAIEVWNNMERVGIKVTIKTWNSMLQGCIKANNAKGIHTVWKKLLASRTPADTAIWTARIHGLFVCGSPDAGLRALDEMAKIWAVRSDPQFAAIAVQPTVEPVNAALAGLLRFGRDGDATKVLNWAAKQNISPDIYTFNTLLRPLVRRGDMAGIDEVFATMRTVNIQADVATFTVLLEGTLTDIGALPPARQVDLVKRILAEMKSAGVEINMQTYAKILYLLLREGDRANEPVKAVLAHIWRRGLELTSHIYTMLAEHYFARDPPDAAAVTALIENRRLHGNKAIDRVFWERVIKGYCQAGETARALDIFDRVFVAGATITFGTLHELLRALIVAADMVAAARVVSTASQIGRAEDEAAAAGGAHVAGHGGEGKRHWKHRFWHLAYEHGLLGGEEADRFREATVAEEGL